MGSSNSILSYEKEADMLEKAINSERGLRATFESEREAIHFIHRCNKFRVLDRRRSKSIYLEPAHEMHGASVYDRIVIRRDGAKVIMEKLPPVEKKATVEEL